MNWLNGSKAKKPAVFLMSGKRRRIIGIYSAFKPGTQRTGPCALKGWHTQMKWINPFSMNKTIRSYWYPSIKIIICLFILIILVFRNRIFANQSNLLQLPMTVIALILCICSILAIYVSIAEIIFIHYRRKDRKAPY